MFSMLVGFVIIAAAAVSPEERHPEETGDRFYVYRDGDPTEVFVPSGLMPRGNGVLQNTKDTSGPQSGRCFVRFECDLSVEPWVGAYFLLDGRWEPKKRFNLFEKLGVNKGDPIKCRFWARSRDGAVVQFKVGGVTKGAVSDSLVTPEASQWVTLPSNWTMYEIDLTGKDLTSVVGAFVWVCDRGHNEKDKFRFDLDNIYFVKIKSAR